MADLWLVATDPRRGNPWFRPRAYVSCLRLQLVLSSSLLIGRVDCRMQPAMIPEKAMSFKLSLWKTKMKNISTSREHSSNNNLNQVLIGECKSRALIAGAKVDVGRSGKKPLSQSEMQIHFGVDKRTAETATAPAPPGALSASRVPS